MEAVKLHDTRLTHHLCNNAKGVIFPDMLHCHKVAGVDRQMSSPLGRHGRNRETLTRFAATVSAKYAAYQSTLLLGDSVGTTKWKCVLPHTTKNDTIWSETL